MKKNILICVAHPDDEVFGMGATISKYVQNGDTVHCVAFSHGTASRNSNPDDEEKRLKQASKAAKILGFNWIKILNFPDNEFDSIPLLSFVKELEIIKDQINPDIVFTHYKGDLNIDHQIIFKATLTAFRPMANEKAKEIYSFEVPSATDYSLGNISGCFSPNVFHDIKDYWDIKVQSIKAYEGELMEHPNSRSLESINYLSKYRGSCVGIDRAEAFMLIRKTIS